MADAAARRPEGSGAGWGWTEAIVLVLAAHFVLIVGGSFAIGDRATDDVIPIATQMLATIPFWIWILVGSWVLVSRTTDDVPEALGLRVRPIDVPLGIGVGVAMQLVVLPLLYWPILHVLDIDPDEVDRLARELVDTARGAGQVTMLVLLTCVFAPLTEELLYRGVLQRGAGRTNALVGVAIAAVVFGVAHFQSLQLFGLVLFGGAAGLLAWRTGRLGPAVIAHAAFNATTVIKLLAER